MFLEEYLGPEQEFVDLPLTKEQRDRIRRENAVAPAFEIKYPTQERFEDFQQRCQTKIAVTPGGQKRRRLAGNAVVDTSMKNADLAMLLVDECVVGWRGFTDKEGKEVPFDLTVVKKAVKRKLTYWLISTIAEAVILIEEEENEKQTEDE